MKVKRRAKRILIAAATATLLAALTVWMLFQHIPAWYNPVDVPPERYQRVRDNILETQDNFTREIMTAEPFSFTLYDSDINEWIAARHAIWKPAEKWIPPEIQNPVLRFRPGYLVLAGLVQHKNVQVIASIHFSAEIQGDHIHLKLERVQGGSLPLPVSWLLDTAVQYWQEQSAADLKDRFADRSLELDDIVQRIAALPDGTDFPNVITWPNGHRDLLIESITFGEGTCTLRVRPYAPGYSNR